MRTPILLAGLLLLTASTSGRSQAPKGNAPKNVDDLPDVALVIPEDTRPEVKAIIKSNVHALASKSAAERAKAAEVLGELREQGKPVRRLLCQAMLDSSANVRVAAADALKSIDPKMQYLAVTLVSEYFRAPQGGLKGQRSGVGTLTANSPAPTHLLREIQKLKEDGEPLTPLITYDARLNIAAKDIARLQVDIATLSSIARNDLSAYKLIAPALDNPNSDLRHSALEAVAQMKHGRQSRAKILALLKSDIPGNRIAAIAALVALVDESTEEQFSEAIRGQRYHQDAEVRKAVEVALNKLEYKKKP